MVFPGSLQHFCSFLCDFPKVFLKASDRPPPHRVAAWEQKEDPSQPGAHHATPSQGSVPPHCQPLPPPPSLHFHFCFPSSPPYAHAHGQQ